MISRTETILVMIDVQERLLPVMQRRDELVAACGKLLDGAALLDLPVIVTEQIPDKLGPTDPALVGKLTAPVLAKDTFSCCGDSAFLDAVEQSGRNHVAVFGIETHVCVYQTVIELLERGCEVSIIADAVSSRHDRDRDMALLAMQQAGARPVSVELLLFALQRKASGESFKNLLKLVK